MQRLSDWDQDAVFIGMEFITRRSHQGTNIAIFRNQLSLIPPEPLGFWITDQITEEASLSLLPSACAAIQHG